MGWRAAFIALITALLCAAPASAATLTVTTSGDPGGTCTGTTCTTLRAAIAEAGTPRRGGHDHGPGGRDQHHQRLRDQLADHDHRRRARARRSSTAARSTAGSASPVRARSSSRAFTIRNGAAGGGDFADGGGIYNAGNLAHHRRPRHRQAARSAWRRHRQQPRCDPVADNLLVDNNVASGAGGGGIHNTGGSEIANQRRLADPDRLDDLQELGHGHRRRRRHRLVGQRRAVIALALHDRRQRRRRARHRWLRPERQQRRSSAASSRATSSSARRRQLRRQQAHRRRLQRRGRHGLRPRARRR